MNSKILYFDIETCPNLAWVWSGGKQYVTDEQILEPSRIICISYLWEDDTNPIVLRWDKNQCDKSMLQKFHKVLEKADVVLGHNGQWFDVKHVNTRFAYHKLEPMPLYSIEDTLMQARSNLRLPSYKLRYLAKYFNLPIQKMRTDTQLWLDVWLNKDKPSLNYMCDYCAVDTLLLREVAKRIEPYCKFKFNRNLINGGDPESCPSCSGKLESKGYYKSSVSIKKRVRCQKCFKSFTLGGNLINKSLDIKSTEIPR